MNSLAFVAFFAVLAVTYAAPSATIIQGPSAKSTVVGSDGSIISSVAPGGQIVAEEHPGVIAHAAPVHVAPAVVSTYGHAHATPAVVSAYSHSPAVVSTYSHAPVVVSSYSHAAPAVVSSYSHAAPAVVSAYSHGYHASPVVAHAAPVVAYSAPVVAHAGHSTFDTLVAGPSGTIATSKTVADPAVVAAHGVHASAVHGYGHGLYY